MGAAISKNKRLAKNTLLLYVRMIFVMLVALYTTRIILKALGVVDYGIYNVVAGFVSLFAVINNCLTTGTNRFYNYAIGKEDEDEINRVYNTSLRIQLIFLLLLIILTEVFGSWYIENRMVIPPDRLFAAKIIFHCAVFSLAMLMFQIPYSAAVMAYERMDFYALVSIFDAVGKLAIVYILMIISYDKLIIYGLLLSGISVINFCLYFFYCKKNFPSIRLKRHTDKKLFKSLLSFSGWSTLDPFSYIFRDQGSNLVLNSFFGPIVNAAYGIAAQISGAVTSFASNMSIAFRPQIIQSYSGGDYLRAKSLMLSMSRINYLLQLLVAIPLVFELEYILSLWLGESYPQYTIVFSTLVLMTNCFNTLNEPISIIMVATGHIKKIKTISMIIICMVVPVGYCLFRWGYPPYTIYVVMFLLTIINQISCVIIMSKEFKELQPGEYFKTILLPCAIFTAISLVIPYCVTTMMKSSFIRLLMTIVLTVPCTLATGYFVLFNYNEKQMIFNIYNKFRKKRK